MPERIQLSRKKGWRMPPNTIKVARGRVEAGKLSDGGWGNPFVIGLHTRDAAEAVAKYHEWITACLAPDHPSREATIAALQTLRGKNLACWCKLGQPCHADVLLKLANDPANG